MLSCSYISSGVTYLLDDYPACAAWSIRKLRSSYTGHCCRIRRSSDNAEIDIGFSGNIIDIAAINSFLGTGAGNYVKIYDQVGSLDIIQATAAEQPIVKLNALPINQLLSYPAWYYNSNSDGSNRRLINNSVSLNQPFTLFVVAQSSAKLRSVIFDAYNTNRTLFYRNDTLNNLRLGADNGGAEIGIATSTDASSFFTLFNGANSALARNSAAATTGNAGTNAMSGISIGHIRGNPSPISTTFAFDGNIAEVIAYSGNKTSDRAAIQSNQNDFWGFNSF